MKCNGKMEGGLSLKRQNIFEDGFSWCIQGRLKLLDTVLICFFLQIATYYSTVSSCYI